MWACRASTKVSRLELGTCAWIGQRAAGDRESSRGSGSMGDRLWGCYSWSWVDRKDRDPWIWVAVDVGQGGKPGVGGRSTRGGHPSAQRVHAPSRATHTGPQPYCSFIHCLFLGLDSLLSSPGHRELNRGGTTGAGRPTGGPPRPPSPPSVALRSRPQTHWHEFGTTVISSRNRLSGGSGTLTLLYPRLLPARTKQTSTQSHRPRSRRCRSPCQRQQTRRTCSTHHTIRLRPTLTS